jgi:hypothetical protein
LGVFGRVRFIWAQFSQQEIVTRFLIGVNRNKRNMRRMKTAWTDLNDNQKATFKEAEERGFREAISDKAWDILLEKGGWDSNANENTEIIGGPTEANLIKSGEELGRIAAKCFEEEVETIQSLSDEDLENLAGDADGARYFLEVVDGKVVTTDNPEGIEVKPQLEVDHLEEYLKELPDQVGCDMDNTIRSVYIQGIYTLIESGDDSTTYRLLVRDIAKDRHLKAIKKALKEAGYEV